MAKYRDTYLLCFFSLSLFLTLSSSVHGWGVDGHFAVCSIAQSYINDAALKAVKQILPEYAAGELASLCSWADRVKFRYHWSSPLHYIDVPDSSCTFLYNRDCKDEDGIEGRCVAGAINNYTTQLLTYKNDSSQTQYNLTEALLFLSHLMGDIHQPLHVGHTSDRGGNTIDVHWYTRKANLHHVWDESIIETAEERFHNSNVNDLIDSVKHKIETEWASDETEWGKCAGNSTTCPNIYASESSKAACDWAYNGVTEDSLKLESDWQQLSIASLGDNKTMHVLPEASARSMV
ncbi:hypothetical protein V2J09_003617 [Rumex salicifolius]